MIDPFRRADPGKFRPVEPNFFRAEKLIDVNARINQPETQTVGFGDVIDMVGRDDGPGARHVLHHDSGIPRNVLAEILSYKASPVVLCPSNRVPHHNGDRLTLKKFLRSCLWNAGEKSKAGKENGKTIYPLHKSSHISSIVWG